MKLTWHIPHDHRHDAAVAGFHARPDARIGRFEVAGQVFWIKSVDTPGLINRLQKGPPTAAFDADLAAMKSLAAQGIPVPEIVAEGPGIVVTRDGGPTLERILRDQLGSLDDRVEAFSTAAATLAFMHAKGISHGRPVLRDLCWNDGRLTVLDLENHRPGNNQTHHFRRDLVVFIHSCYAQQREDLPEIVAAKAAYRANDPGGVWQAAADWLHKLRWVGPLTLPLRLRHDPHAREYKAIPPTLRAFRA